MCVLNVEIYVSVNIVYFFFIIGVVGMVGYDIGCFYEIMLSIVKDDYEIFDFVVGFYFCLFIEDIKIGYIYYCLVDS